VHGISAADGRESALVSMGEGKEMAGGAAVDGDFAFIGNRAGGLACIDFKTGESPWESEESEGELFTTPAVTEELVVYSGGDGNVHAVKRDGGAKLWTYESGGMVALSPVIAGEHVAVAIDGVLHLVSLKKGRKEWSFQVSDHVTSPTVTAGMLIVGTDDGYVLAFGSPGKALE